MTHRVVVGGTALCSHCGGDVVRCIAAVQYCTGAVNSEALLRLTEGGSRQWQCKMSRDGKVDNGTGACIMFWVRKHGQGPVIFFKFHAKSCILARFGQKTCFSRDYIGSHRCSRDLALSSADWAYPAAPLSTPTECTFWSHALHAHQRSRRRCRLKLQCLWREYVQLCTCIWSARIYICTSLYFCYMQSWHRVIKNDPWSIRPLNDWLTRLVRNVSSFHYAI